MGQSPSYWTDRADRDSILNAARIEGRVVPIFPVASLVPGSACPHRGPLAHGSPFYCVVCHQTGAEDHSSLVVTAADKLKVKNWKPTDVLGNVVEDPWSGGDTAEPTAYQPEPKGQPETRKQRRARERAGRGH